MTLRNGRYVVPVRAEARSKVKGIVHDASGSGQTLFVEPLVVVELGNAWREAQAAVDEEEGRILDELSSLVGANAHAAARDARGARPVRLLGGQGAPGGRARRHPPRARRPARDRPAVGAPSRAHRSRRPDRPPARRRLHGARDHRPQHRRQDGRPAHASGCCASCTRPASTSRPRRARGCRCCATCSRTSATSSRSPSPCRRSRATCARSSGSSSTPGPGTLVLLDELGAGTDPTEGSALAQALLDHFIRSGALVAATTHYAEIKVYAHETAAGPQRVGRVRPRDRSRRPTGSRSACRAAARRSRSPSGWACPTAIVADARGRLTENQQAFESTLASIREQEGEIAGAVERARRRRGEGRGVDAGRRRGAASGAQGARRGRACRARRGGAAGRGPARRRRRDPPPPGARDGDRAGHRRRAGPSAERTLDRLPASERPRSDRRRLRSRPGRGGSATAPAAGAAAGRAGSPRWRRAARARRSRPAGCASRSSSTTSSRRWAAGDGGDGRVERVAGGRAADARPGSGDRRAAAGEGADGGLVAGPPRRPRGRGARGARRATSTTPRWPASSRCSIIHGLGTGALRDAVREQASATSAGEDPPRGRARRGRGRRDDRPALGRRAWLSRRRRCRRCRCRCRGPRCPDRAAGSSLGRSGRARVERVDRHARRRRRRRELAGLGRREPAAPRGAERVEAAAVEVGRVGALRPARHARRRGPHAPATRRRRAASDRKPDSTLLKSMKVRVTIGPAQPSRHRRPAGRVDVDAPRRRRRSVVGSVPGMNSSSTVRRESRRRASCR